MSYNKEMESIEQLSDWRAGIKLLGNMQDNEPNIYLRVMFLIIDFLVEGQPTEEEYNYAVDKLKTIFENSNKKFSSNAEYLFFAGIMIYMGEWYFGMNDVSVASKMLKRAMNSEPDNVLYKWGYYSITNQLPDVNTDFKLKLSKRILFQETSKLGWLKNKGKLGSYTLELIKVTYQTVKPM